MLLSNAFWYNVVPEFVGRVVGMFVIGGLPIYFSTIRSEVLLDGSVKWTIIMGISLFGAFFCSWVVPIYLFIPVWYIFSFIYETGWRVFFWLVSSAIFVAVINVLMVVKYGMPSGGF